MPSPLMAFGIAVGATSLICFALMTRMQNRRINRRLSSDGGSYPGDDGGSHFLSWIGIDNSTFDSSGHSGGGDSGGGGDGD